RACEFRMGTRRHENKWRLSRRNRLAGIDSNAGADSQFITGIRTRAYRRACGELWRGGRCESSRSAIRIAASNQRREFILGAWIWRSVTGNGNCGGIFAKVRGKKFHVVPTGGEKLESIRRGQRRDARSSGYFCVPRTETELAGFLEEFSVFWIELILPETATDS